MLGGAVRIKEDLADMAADRYSIITVAGLIPGFWASFALIDFWGRRVRFLASLTYLGIATHVYFSRSVQPIQIMGFGVLTVTLCIMGFAYTPLKEKAVGAFVMLFCLSESR